MEEIYKDWKIEYKEIFYGSNEFIATKGDVTLKSHSLADAKKKIDKYKKEKFKRIPCYYKHKEAEITSIAEYDKDNVIKEVWVSYPDPFNLKKRTRCKSYLQFNYLLKRTDENKKIINEIKRLEIKNKEIIDKISTKTSELKQITNRNIKELMEEKR